MMIVRPKVLTLLVIFLLAALAMPGCTLPEADRTDLAPATSAPVDIPTWTPRPQDLSALPTPTRFAPVATTLTITPTLTALPQIVVTPRTVTIAIQGGNLNVRRGPSTDYNYVGVLYNGDVVTATARDRISRWIRVELPSQPGLQGWITTETGYTRITGNVSNLPFIQVEPAAPAYIRNCTKVTILVLPDEVQLLSKFDAPYNEERFAVGLYQIYDLDTPGNIRLDDVNLSEGKTVDIIYDGTGEKSKCE